MAVSPIASRVAAAALPDGLPVLRRAMRAGLGRVFGPPPFDPHDGTGDAGLFGPGSSSWQVIGDPAAIVGGIRALLTQLLHPHAMAGVADHSRFREDALGRLQRTSAYVTGITFASTDEAIALSRRVRRAHRVVQGVAPDGRAYRADDPHLLTWVSIALTSSFLATDRAYAPRAARGSVADGFVAEQSRAAALLDTRVDLDAIVNDEEARASLRAGTLPLPMLDEGLLPTSVTELEMLLDRYRPELGVNDQGREALRFLLLPPVPRVMLAGYLPLLAGALATLDRDARRLLRVPGGPRAAATVRAQTRLLLAGLRTVAGPSPSFTAARRRAARTDAAHHAA